MALTQGTFRPVSELAKIVGAEHVLAGDERAYVEDASRAMGLRGRADAVVRPGTAEEVTAVVAWCYEHDVALIPRGGGTGYAGGRSEEHTSELQSRQYLVCRLLLEKKTTQDLQYHT